DRDSRFRGRGQSRAGVPPACWIRFLASARREQAVEKGARRERTTGNLSMVFSVHAFHIPGDAVREAINTETGRCRCWKLKTSRWSSALTAMRFEHWTTF